MRKTEGKRRPVCFLHLEISRESVGEVAFSTCESLKEENLPSTLTTLGSSVFAMTAIESLTIPASLTDLSFIKNVTTIGTRAFSGCTGLTALTIPKGVTTIGNYGIILVHYV